MWPSFVLRPLPASQWCSARPFRREPTLTPSARTICENANWTPRPSPSAIASLWIRLSNRARRTLPDHLRKGMKLVIVGCNPTESSVRTGHYYSGRENPFWPVLFETGVIPEPLEYRDDKRIIEFAIGLTDLVKRPTRTIDELTREDYAEGRIVLSQKLGEYVPHVIAFNGRSVYEQFAQRRAKLGLQKEPLYGAKVYVLPATDSQHVQNPKDRLLHFRKLAALIRKVETSRDAKPL